MPGCLGGTAAAGVWIFTTCTDPQRIAALHARGARIERAGSAGPVDLAQVLRALAQAGMNEVLVEAGRHARRRTGAAAMCR